MAWGTIRIITYILNFIIIFITFYLFYLLIKSKKFKSYHCYNIIILSFLVFFDNILRIIPSAYIKVLKSIQAFLLTFLDKILLTTIVSQTFLTYFGVCHTDFYFKKNNGRAIFFISLILGIIISAILSFVYLIIAGTKYYEPYYY